MAENSGFPLDDLMDDLETPEPRDDWEKNSKKEKSRALSSWLGLFLQEELNLKIRLWKAL